MINSLQIIVLTDLFELEIPTNAGMVMELILRMCSLEFIDTGILMEYVFNFRETLAFSSKENAAGENDSKFEDAGYDSIIYFELLGPMLLIILIFLLIVLLRWVLKLAFNKASSTNCLKKRLLRKPNYLVGMSRFLLESSIEIGLSAMICVLSLKGDCFEYF